MRTGALLFVLIVVASYGSVHAASIHNTDNQAYFLTFTEIGLTQDIKTQYQILGDVKVEICDDFGCEIYVRPSGQRIKIGPDDDVVINWGVMRVERSFRNTP